MLYKIPEKVIELEREGKKIIKFNIGDPDQETPFQIIKSAFLAAKKGKTKYGSAAGERRLREKIAEIYKVKPERVIISPGSKWTIFAIMYLFLKKGENIILPSPHWTAYKQIGKRIGVKIKFLKTCLESDWEIDLEKLEKSIDKKTKLIILNNPQNPTSKVIDKETIERIVEIANKRRIKILSDETYADISFKKVKSILEFPGEHFFVNSFSKTFSMTGWRLGFAILPERFIKKMISFNQITITCVPPFLQGAAIEALNLKEKIVKRMKKIYWRRLKLALKILSKTKLEFSKPDSPFYLFLKSPFNSEKLAFQLLKKGVAITPGTAFGDYKEYFRISLTLPERELEKGLKILVKFFQCKKS